MSENNAKAPALQVSRHLAFDLEVVCKQQLSESLVRVTLSSPDLVHFGIGSEPLDMRIKVIIPGPENTADHLAGVRPGSATTMGDLGDWYRGWLQIPAADRGWMRTYTVRAQRPTEIDVDMVLHLMPEVAFGHGVAARWAAGAQIGDHITVLGPNRHLVDASYQGIEFRPGAARHVLLAGDETALPAISSILESLPPDMRGHAVIEVPTESDCVPVQTSSRVQVHWLVRGHAPHGEQLERTVRGLVDDDADLAAVLPRATQVGDLDDVNIDETVLWESTPSAGPEAGFYAWLAGEAGVIKRLRRHVVQDLSVDRRRVAFMGYWRQGRPEG